MSDFNNLKHVASQAQSRERLQARHFVFNGIFGLDWAQALMIY